MRGPAVRAIAIAAGGTGGHLFPAASLAEQLARRGHRVVLLTDARSAALAAEILPHVERHVIAGAGIAGRGLRRGARAIGGLARGAVVARHILGRSEFGCVVGFGGYPSVAPVLAACTLRRRPAILLHEQNAVLGRANRLLARRADRLALSFAATSRVPEGIATIVTGNPVRDAIAALAGREYRPPEDRIRLLVLGGSLGARIFGEAVPNAVAALPQGLRERLVVTQQCRAEDLERVRRFYAEIGLECHLAPFLDVAPLLANAHLLLARAGASTCAEIGAVGVPAILVPLPGAIDDHQAANAAAMAAAGAAWVIPQPELARLAALLVDCLADPDALARTARAAAAFGHRDAAESLAALVEQHLETVP